jgi:hypothetical protein
MIGKRGGCTCQICFFSLVGTGLACNRYSLNLQSFFVILSCLPYGGHSRGSSLI